MIQKYLPALVLGIGLVVAVATGLVHADERYDQAVQDYLYQLEQYRASYNDFQLKREQFNKIDSFANQEVLVSATKVMLTLRAKVWHTYWQALKSDVSTVEGIDGTIRQHLITNLESVQQFAQSHEATVSALTDRDDLLEEGVRLNEYKQDYNNLVYRTLLELRIARFHWALLQLEDFAPILRNNIGIQIRDAGLREQKLRGMNEVEQLLDVSREQYGQVIAEYYKVKQIRNYENKYEEVMEQLEPVYDPMKRAQQLMSELAEGTVL
jgi:hypothetical protein